jgi:hypothetical protein
MTRTFLQALKRRVRLGQRDNLAELANRLRRARPGPDGAFERRLRHDLSVMSTAARRERGGHWIVIFALITAGVALLLVALAVAAS